MGLILDGKQVVIVCTGHGLKDPDIADLSEPTKVKPIYEEVIKLL
jgi:threonine synthase